MLGEACALGAALIWSISVILFKRSEAVSPLAMNLFKNVVALALLLATLPVLGVGLDLDRPPREWALLALSGVLGIAVADTLVFVALRRLGASLMAVCEAVYAPSIVALSVLFLGEPVRGGFLLGGALVVGGVLLATSERTARATPPAPGAPAPASPLVGILAGVTSMVAMAIGVILAKPILAHGHLVEVTVVRTAAGVLGQLAWMAVFRRQRDAFAVFRPAPVWRTLIPASILGTYVSMLLWLGGFKWTSASVASVLNQLSSVFTIALAWLVLREPVSGRRATGGLVAVAGAILVLLRP